MSATCKGFRTDSFGVVNASFYDNYAGVSPVLRGACHARVVVSVDPSAALVVVGCNFAPVKLLQGAESTRVASGDSWGRKVGGGKSGPEVGGRNVGAGKSGYAVKAGGGKASDAGT